MQLIFGIFHILAYFSYMLLCYNDQLCSIFQIEKDLIDTCSHVLKILDGILIPQAPSPKCFTIQCKFIGSPEPKADQVSFKKKPYF